MNIKFSPPDITDLEIAEVVDTLKSGWITTGPKTKKLEREIARYCNTNRAVCLNSATASMEMTLRLLGVGPGDEVITSAYTYTASASVIHHVGATIVLVDTAKDSYEMDYDALEDAITEKTKVIIPVDIAGVLCNYDRLFEIVSRKKHLFKSENKMQDTYKRVIIMADAAHSFGATHKGEKSGELADFTCFSLHAVKNLTTGEGGAVTWKSSKQINDEEIYHQYMLLSLHGQSKDALEKSETGSWEYDIIAPNYKCNMTDIMASIGLIQLDRYDELLKRRKEIIRLYDSLLGTEQLEILAHLDKTKESSGHLYLTRVKGIDEIKRNEIISNLANKGIPTNVHYKPLPLLTAYKKLGFSINKYPNALEMYKNEITLPLHTLLTNEMLEYISTEFLNEIRNI